MIDQLQRLSKLAYHLRGEEGDITVEDLDYIADFETEALAELWLACDEYKTTVNQVERLLNDELAERMEKEGSSFTVGDWQIFRGYKSTSEKCIDSEGFLNWMILEAQEDPRLLHRLLNPNNVRKGSLPPAVRETFFEKSRPPKTEKQAVAAPVQVLEDNRKKKELADG